jgi:hypothetical protein
MHMQGIIPGKQARSQSKYDTSATAHALGALGNTFPLPLSPLPLRATCGREGGPILPMLVSSKPLTSAS